MHTDPVLGFPVGPEHVGENVGLLQGSALCVFGDPGVDGVRSSFRLLVSCGKSQGEWLEQRVQLSRLCAYSADFSGDLQVAQILILLQGQSQPTDDKNLLHPAASSTTYQAILEESEILSKGDSRDGIGRHQSPPFEDVRTACLGFPSNPGNRSFDLLSNLWLPVLAQGRFAEWSCQDSAPYSMNSWINCVEDIDGVGPKPVIPLAFQKATPNLVDSVVSFEISDVDFIRPQAYDIAIDLVKSVNVVDSPTFEGVPREDEAGEVGIPGAGDSS